MRYVYVFAVAGQTAEPNWLKLYQTSLQKNLMKIEF